MLHLSCEARPRDYDHIDLLCVQVTGAGRQYLSFSLWYFLRSPLFLGLYHSMTSVARCPAPFYIYRVRGGGFWCCCYWNLGEGGVSLTPEKSNINFPKSEVVLPLCFLRVSIWSRPYLLSLSHPKALFSHLDGALIGPKSAILNLCGREMSH